MNVKKSEYETELLDIINGMKSNRFQIDQFKKKSFRKGIRYTITLTDTAIPSNDDKPSYTKKKTPNASSVKKSVKKEKVIIPPKTLNSTQTDDKPLPPARPPMAEITSLGKV